MTDHAGSPRQSQSCCILYPGRRRKDGGDPDHESFFLTRFYLSVRPTHILTA